MAIILEDDCVPHLSFFSFCQTMLERYKSNPSVMHIAGTRWNDEFYTGQTDYFFSSIGHVWGWATWKRAWEKYDFHMKDWNNYLAKDTTEKLFNDRRISKYWNGAFEYVYLQSKKHTWDYQWQYCLFNNNGLSVIPSVNLISNIGLNGVHASDEHSPNLLKETFNWINQERHPLSITRNADYDKYHMLNHFPVIYPIRKRFKKALQKITGRL
jgi:hypothetical protein